MKITLLEVENYKKVKKVVISPGERSTILIAGNNKQGKSSLIGAMSAALGGVKEAAQEPIRRGEKRADIRIELDGGELTIHRKFLDSGTSTLEVKSKDGKLGSPQKILDKLINSRFLDPLRFAHLPEKEQREVLLKSVDVGMDLDKHEADRKEVFESRTDVNRETKRLETELASVPFYKGPKPELVDVTQAIHELDELTGSRDKHRDATAKLESVRANFVSTKDKLAKAQELVEELTKELDSITLDGSVLKKSNHILADELVVALDHKIDAQRKKISASSEVNEQAIKTRNDMERSEKLKGYFKQSTEKGEKMTARLAEMDKVKAEALAKAKMPIPGLDIDPERIIYKSVPLSQASGAEQLQVSLAIAAALSPELQDIWVQDGALLDLESLEIVDQFAKDNNLRIWLERVGESDASALIMEEGELRK